MSDALALAQQTVTVLVCWIRNQCFNNSLTPYLFSPLNTTLLKFFKSRFLSISAKSEEANMKYPIVNSYMKNVDQTSFFLFLECRMEMHKRNAFIILLIY